MLIFFPFKAFVRSELLPHSGGISFSMVNSISCLQLLNQVTIAICSW